MTQKQEHEYLQKHKEQFKHEQQLEQEQHISISDNRTNVINELMNNLKQKRVPRFGPNRTTPDNQVNLFGIFSISDQPI